MSVPKNHHRFLTTIAEIAQKVMKHEVQVIYRCDGTKKSFRPGLSGKILDALYDARLDDLKAALSATSFGGALLSFLDAHGTQIDFSHRLAAEGTASNLNTIELRSGATNAMLLGVIAHETRHVWQMKVLGAGYSPALPPEVVVARDIMMEADAFSFQQKFLQDYAHKTGDSAVLQQFVTDFGLQPAVLALDDRERFVYWAERVRHTPCYLGQMVEQMERSEKAMRNNGIDRYPPRATSWQTILQMGTVISGSWPFKAQEGKPDAYLARFPEGMLAALVGPPEPLHDKMAHFNDVYDSRCLAAPPRMALVARPAPSPAPRGARP